MRNTAPALTPAFLYVNHTTTQLHSITENTCTAELQQWSQKINSQINIYHQLMMRNYFHARS